MGKTSGLSDLKELIRKMEPVLNDGEYVFTSVKEISSIPRAIAIAEIKEKEGITVVLPKVKADQLELAYDFVAAWITLNVHSALEAVGLTAAFSAALGKEGISCNVIAGYYHDHIFVATQDRERAMKVLWEMTQNQT